MKGRVALPRNGFTLIEILVALVVLAFGIVGVIAIQATAKKGSFEAEQRSVAVALGNDILARMRANPAAALTNLYNGSYGNGANAFAIDCSGPGANCDFANMAAYDRFQFEQTVMGANVTALSNNAAVGGLVEPLVCVRQQAGAVTVVVSWQSMTSTSAGGANNDDAFIAGCGAENEFRRQHVLQSFLEGLVP